MLSSLPSLAPRDSYALWYTSSHSANLVTHQEPTNPTFDHLAPLPGSQNIGSQSQRRSQQNGAHRTPLARLRADELYMERRKQNVQNYGSSWIKPPGVSKSLHQIREERRELEEHQEALRREQLAQELAEADGGSELLQGEGGDGEMEEGRDLDDDILDADTTGIDAEDSENDGGENATEAVAAGIPAAYQAFREAVARDEIPGPSRFGLRGPSPDTDDEDDQSQLLQEEDLIHERDQHDTHVLGLDMDMDADLDDDVPEAETGEYEHTDTEEELDTSEDDESVDMGRLPQGRLLNTSMVRSDGTQNSSDLNGTDFQGDLAGGVNSPRHRLGTGPSGRVHHS